MPQDYLSADVMDDTDAAQAAGRSRAYASYGYVPPRPDALTSGSPTFSAPRLPKQRTPAGVVTPLTNPTFRGLHAKREILKQTEELYHQQLEDFDKGEGAALLPEKDPATGREIRPGPAQAHLQGLINRSQGDTSTEQVPKEVRVAAKNIQLLREKRERIAGEAQRVSQARQAFDQDVYMPARSAMLGDDGSGAAAPATAAAAADATPPMDYMQREGGDPISFPRGTVLRSGAPPGPKGGGGEPTPPPAVAKAPAPIPAPRSPAIPNQEPDLDSLQRIKQRRDDYQATLEAGGDNLRQDVRDRLKSQVSVLDSKFQQGAMDQADAIHRQFSGHVTGQAAQGKPVDPKAAAQYFDQFKTLAQTYAGHQGAVIDEANKQNITIPHIPDYVTDPLHPAVGEAVIGAINGLADVASGLTSNTNVMLLGAFGTLARAAELGYAPARAALQTAQAYFTKKMTEGSYQASKRVVADVKDPNATLRQTASDVTQALANAGMAAGTVHGLKNEVTGGPGASAVEAIPSPAVDASMILPPSETVPPGFGQPKAGTPADGREPLQLAPAGHVADYGAMTFQKAGDGRWYPKQDLDAHQPKAGEAYPPDVQSVPADSAMGKQLEAKAKPQPGSEPAVPMDEGLSGKVSALRAAATKAKAEAPAEPETLDHRAAGYDSPEAFTKDFEDKAQHDVFETKEEFLKRIYCSQLGRGNFSIK